MEKKNQLNLVEILKDCPVDTKLYSPFLGYVWFKGIRKTNDGCIDVVACCDDKFPFVHSFFANGKYYNYTDTEVSLFPDKGQRDWSKFKVAKPKFDIATLKPFDKVLVRETNEDRWLIDFYAFYNEIQEFSCVKGMYEQCIPYEGNEHLFLSFDDCDAFYKTWE